MKKVWLHLGKKAVKKQLQELRENLENLNKLGFYSPDEYKLYLDQLENTELYLTLKSN